MENKKTMKFKHRILEHLLYKYKVVEKENCYEEYYRCRVWFIICYLLIGVVLSPIVVTFYIASDFKDFWWNDKECYIYQKENKKE